jgi:hypothetical protein
MTIRTLVPAAAAVVVLGAAAWIMPRASAQTMWDTVKVTLPYTVTIGDKTLPPGDYTIKQLQTAGGDSPVLQFFNGKAMKFETSALTIHTVDVNTPSDTTVSLHHLGDNYYFDKIWIAGKNYGYEIPLPKNVTDRESEAAAVSVPAQIDTTSTTVASTASDTTATTVTVPATPPEPVPTPEPVASAPAPPPPTPPQPTADTDTQQQQPTPPTPPPDENSANREKRPDDTNDTPNMPATSAGWLAMLLSGGTLSGAGMMLRRRQRS